MNILERFTAWHRIVPAASDTIERFLADISLDFPLIFTGQITIVTLVQLGR